MSDNNELDREALERATRPGEQVGEQADLREGFLALGRAVDEAQAHWTEDELLARLNRPAPGDKASQPQSSARFTLWQWVATGALAASALFATARILLTTTGDAVQVVTTTEQGHSVAGAPAVPPVAVDASPVDDDAGSVAAALPEHAWDDPIDEQIGSAASALEGLAGAASDVDRSLADFRDQLESLSADLTSSSL